MSTGDEQHRIVAEYQCPLCPYNTKKKERFVRHLRQVSFYGTYVQNLQVTGVFQSIHYLEIHVHLFAIHVHGVIHNIFCNPKETWFCEKAKLLNVCIQKSEKIIGCSLRA